jgi:hypothetical protein
MWLVAAVWWAEYSLHRMGWLDQFVFNCPLGFFHRLKSYQRFHRNPRNWSLLWLNWASLDSYEDPVTIGLAKNSQHLASIIRCNPPRLNQYSVSHSSVPPPFSNSTPETDPNSSSVHLARPHPPATRMNSRDILVRSS